jgi:hypothetical protein
MARAKRNSAVLETARQRLAGLKKINDPEPDFGPALTVKSYEDEIKAFSDDQDGYNGDVAALDDKQNRLNFRERNLADMSQRVQAGVKAQYGPDSSEYELVGGIRRSERKKPVRKPKS